MTGTSVRREDFEPLYGQFLDPRDPAGRTYLGSPPRVNAELAAIYQAKLAAHPGATADERMRLLAEARAEHEGPVGVQYFDTTFSVDKTISLAHASALASAVEARQAGDLSAAAKWEARAAGIWAEIEKSVRLYVRHMQGEAAYVRTGHHGQRIDGVETGGSRTPREIPVAIFPQHTSRNGDPQLHVHVLWLNKVETVRDGKWRSIDSCRRLGADHLRRHQPGRGQGLHRRRPGARGPRAQGPPRQASARRATRNVPIPPELVTLSRAHRPVRHRRGRPAVSQRERHAHPALYLPPVWAKTGTLALTPAQRATPLMRRPYDLRHSGITWRLNSGVPPTEVAAWAGHSVEMLLRVYARCVAGLEDVWIARMEATLRPPGTQAVGEPAADHEDHEQGEGA